MLIGTATTSSSEDNFGRVKVSCPVLWEEESSLIPVLNSVFISKGDEVILFSPENLQQSIFVLGKFQTKSNQTEDPVPTENKSVLFKANVSGAYIVGTLDEKTLKIETDAGLSLEITKDSLIANIPQSYTNSSGAIALKASSGDFTITSKAGYELFSCLSEAFNTLQTTQPTTLGSPSAQNFNPAIISALTKVETELDSF